MIKVKKDNRILSVDETAKDYYLAEGYDVVKFAKDKGEYQVVESATGGRSYTVAEYNALKDENAALKAKIAELKQSEGKEDTVKKADKKSGKGD